MEVSVSFSPGSVTRGALLIIHGGVGAEKSSLLLPLGRDMTSNYTLPFSFPTGQFRTFWYDIERDGTFTNGVNYPAVTGELTKISTGMLVITQLCYNTYACPSVTNNNDHVSCCLRPRSPSETRSYLSRLLGFTLEGIAPKICPRMHVYCSWLGYSLSKFVCNLHRSG